MCSVNDFCENRYSLSPKCEVNILVFQKSITLTFTETENSDCFIVLSDYNIEYFSRFLFFLYMYFPITSYWSSSSVVIVVLNKLLFDLNFYITYVFQYYYLNIKILKFYENLIFFNFLKILNFLWNFWNFEIVLKFLKFWNFLKFLKFSLF
jgi:hypothetical protein